MMSSLELLKYQIQKLFKFIFNMDGILKTREMICRRWKTSKVAKRHFV